MTNLPRHLTVFCTGLLLYSVWDGYEHVSREGTDFAAHPGAWWAFTAASTLTLLAVFVAGSTLGARRGADGRAVRTSFVREALALTAGVSVHVFLSGPLYVRTLFPYGHIEFKPVAAAVLSAGLVLLLGVLRLVLRPRDAGQTPGSSTSPTKRSSASSRSAASPSVTSPSAEA